MRWIFFLIFNGRPWSSQITIICLLLSCEHSRISNFVYIASCIWCNWAFAHAIEVFNLCCITVLVWATALVQFKGILLCIFDVDHWSWAFSSSGLLLGDRLSLICSSFLNKMNIILDQVRMWASSAVFVDAKAVHGNGFGNNSCIDVLHRWEVQRSPHRRRSYVVVASAAAQKRFCSLDENWTLLETEVLALLHLAELAVIPWAHTVASKIPRLWSRCFVLE